jgi:uncharacterized coiled-coil DUF342 family protein
MTVRLYSLVVIINCILPFLIFFGLAVFFKTFWTTVQTQLEPPVTQLIEDAKALAEHARTAAKTVATTSELIKAEAKNAAASIAALVEPLTSFKIEIPPVNIPVFNLKGCDLNLNVLKALNLQSCFKNFNVLKGLSDTINAGLNKTFAGPRAEFQKISDSVTRTLDEVNKLSPLAEEFRAQAREFSQRAEVLNAARHNMQAELAGLPRIIAWCIGALFLWAGFSYLVWVWAILKRNWQTLLRAA